MPLILENVLLSPADGLVQSGSQIWVHYQKYPWDLSHPELNPVAGEHSRHIEARLTQDLWILMFKNYTGNTAEVINNETFKR